MLQRGAQLISMNVAVDGVDDVDDVDANVVAVVARNGSDYTGRNRLREDEFIGIISRWIYERSAAIGFLSRRAKPADAG